MINDLNDLIRVAAEWPGDDGWNDDPNVDEAMAKWFAYWLRDTANEKGYEYGMDWDLFFDLLDYVEMVDMVMTEFQYTN